MGLAVDATTPARFAGTPADNVDITSASFTPPNNSLLVACINGDSVGASSLTISVSGGSLTWTARPERKAGEAGATAGYSGIFTAPVGTGASMTVNVRRTAGSGSSNRLSCKCYVLTGENASPIGANNEGNSTTNNLTTASVTTGAANSFLFGVGTDWNQLGSPVSSDLTEDSADYAGQISVTSGYKLVAAAGAATANLDAGGTGAADWDYVLLEIKEAAGTAASQPTQTTIPTALLTM